MVGSCVVGGCSNTTSSSSNRRDFLILHKASENPAIRSNWDSRINRPIEHAKSLKRYSVCSDHFADEDYNQSYFMKYKVLGYKKYTKLPILEDAVPNTLILIEQQVNSGCLFTSSWMRNIQVSQS